MISGGKDTHYFPFHQMFGGFSRHFRYVIKSKSDEARAGQQARLIAMPSRGCSSAQAKERFLILDFTPAKAGLDTACRERK